MATIEDLEKLGLKSARVLEAERIEGSDKLIKLKVSLGSEERQILAGIGKSHNPEDLINTDIIVVSNLESRMLMGFESQGMLLASTDKDGKVALLRPEKETPPGTIIK